MEKDSLRFARRVTNSADRATLARPKQNALVPQSVIGSSLAEPAPPPVSELSNSENNNLRFARRVSNTAPAIPRPRRAKALTPDAPAFAGSSTASSWIEPVRLAVGESSKPLVFFAAILIFIHFGRPFDTFLNGLRIPAVICTLGILVAALSGGMKLITSKTSVTLLLLIAWMAVCAPFSYWRGGSFRYVLWYVQFFLPLMLVLAVAVRTLKDIVVLSGVLALSCFFHLLVHANEVGGRFALSGTFGNSDDVALLAGFAIPFVVLSTGSLRNPILRFGLAGIGCAYLLVLIGKTATRAAIPALLAMLLIYLIRSRAASKLIILVFAIVGVLGTLVVLPKSTLERLASVTDVFNFVSDKARIVDYQDEAAQSLRERKELMNDAINATLTHPIFGIGPGMFVEYRFHKSANANGTSKPYLPSHNTYLEIASESGLVGLSLYLAFLITIAVTIRRNRKLNRSRPNPDPLQDQVCLCLEAAVVYFTVCAAFMTCDRHPHQFVIAGFAIALAKITIPADEREAEEAQQAAVNDRERGAAIPASPRRQSVLRRVQGVPERS